MQKSFVCVFIFLFALKVELHVVKLEFCHVKLR